MVRRTRWLYRVAYAIGADPKLGPAHVGKALAKINGDDPNKVGKGRGWQLINEYLHTHPEIRGNRKKKKAKEVDFYSSMRWRQLRYVVLKKRGAKCECCGATPDHGKLMHVDHIKPRSLFPELELDENNLQVLCEECNIGKSNLDQTDWRGEATLQ